MTNNSLVQFGSLSNLSLALVLRHTRMECFKKNTTVELQVNQLTDNLAAIRRVLTDSCGS